MRTTHCTWVDIFKGLEKEFLWLEVLATLGLLTKNPILDSSSGSLGRKSYLRHVEDRALKEIKQAKQKSLKGVLKTTQSP